MLWGGKEGLQRGIPNKFQEETGRRVQIREGLTSMEITFPIRSWVRGGRGQSYFWPTAVAGFKRSRGNHYGNGNKMELETENIRRPVLVQTSQKKKGRGRVRRGCSFLSGDRQNGEKGKEIGRWLSRAERFVTLHRVGGELVHIMTRTPNALA